MKYSDAVNDELVQEAMTQKVMRVFGVSEEAAREYLEKFDVDISYIAKIEMGTKNWALELRHIIWGTVFDDATDEEILAKIGGVLHKKEVE